MYDFSKSFASFHEQHVRLTRDQQKDMRQRRDNNKDRIVTGLAELGKPAIVETINQGGYAQKTMTQPPENNQESRYDIDLGVVFDKDDSIGAKSTRKWVKEAVARKATNMKNDPELKKKCVRVVYANGYQCDFPVFRRSCDGTGCYYELSSGEEWVASDPAAMNSWLYDQMVAKSPESTDGYQLRRIVRLLKYFCKVHAHRKGASFPSGLVASALAVEAYVAKKGRDDEAFRETLRCLSVRSEHASVYANGQVISDEKDVDRIKRLIDEASETVKSLDELNNQDTTETDARRAWKKVFRHSFFNQSATAAVAGLSVAEKAGRLNAEVSSRRSEGGAAKPWGSKLQK